MDELECDHDWVHVVDYEGASDVGWNKIEYWECRYCGQVSGTGPRGWVSPKYVLGDMVDDD